MIKTINTFDAVINSLPQKGYVVLHMNKEDSPFYIHYDTRKELVKDFNLEEGHYENSIFTLSPRHIVKDWNGSLDILIKGNTEIYVEHNCLYLVEDGKLKNYER